MYDFVRRNKILCAEGGLRLLLCRLTPEGLRNERTGESIEGRVVGWREPKRRYAWGKGRKGWLCIGLAAMPWRYRIRL